MFFLTVKIFYVCLLLCGYFGQNKYSVANLTCFSTISVSLECFFSWLVPLDYEEQSQFTRVPFSIYFIEFCCHIFRGCCNINLHG